MMLRAIDQDWDAKVFSEFSAINLPVGPGLPGRDPRGRHSIRMRPLIEVDARLQRIHFPIVALKPLAESQRANQILDALQGSRAIWMYRDYHDVSRSIVRTFGHDVHRRNLEPIVNDEARDWRSELVAEEVRTTVAEHYSPEMDPLDGAALFWYARNRLFFDQRLADDPRVLLLRYEELVADPPDVFGRIYDLAGLPAPDPRVATGIHVRSVGAGRQAKISPGIAELCDALWERLTIAGERQPGFASPRLAPTESPADE